ISLPDFAHVWFLPYLFIYSTVTAIVWKTAPQILEGAQRRIEALPLAVIVAGVMIWFAGGATFVEPPLLRTKLFVNDVSGHAVFAGVFLLGFLIARSQVFWARLVQHRKPIWLLTLVFLSITTALFLDHRERTLLAAQGCYGGAMLLSILAWGAES